VSQYTKHCSGAPNARPPRMLCSALGSVPRAVDGMPATYHTLFYGSVKLIESLLSWIASIPDLCDLRDKLRRVQWRL